MRNLLVALLLVCAASSAQNINELPLFGETPKSQEAVAADQRFIDAAIKAAGSVEVATRMETARGWQLLKQGDTETAIQSFNQAYLLNPHNAEAYWGLGAAATQQGKYDVAARLFDRAYTRDPKNVRLLADVGLARIRAAMGQSKDPIAQTKQMERVLLWFDAAEKIAPTYPLTYANRAVALYILGNFTASWENIQKAEALDHNSVDPRLIADLSKKFPRPATVAAAPAPDTAKVKTGTVIAQANVMQDSPQTSRAMPKTMMPKIAQGMTEDPVPAPEPQPTPEIQPTPEPQPIPEPARAPEPQPAPAPTPEPQPAPEVQPETQAVLAPQVETKPTPQPQPEVQPASKVQTEAAPTPKKTLRVISGQPARPVGADKRACLDLPTNEAIMRCVYPRK